VIVAIVKSGRTPAPPAEPVVEIVPPDPPPPQVVVVDRPVVHEVAVAVPFPVYVAVGGRSRVRHRDLPYVPQSPFGLFEIPTVSPAARRPEGLKHAEPVYWGWGGKRRPDAWDPAPPPPNKR
jgi:hypothetical protein